MVESCLSQYLACNPQTLSIAPLGLHVIIVTRKKLQFKRCVKDSQCLKTAENRVVDLALKMLPRLYGLTTIRNERA